MTSKTVGLTRLLTVSLAEKTELNRFQTTNRFCNTKEIAATAFPSTVSEEAILESAAKLGGEIASWWIEEPPDSEGGLCSVCKHINFDAILHKTDGLIDEIFLGTLQTITKKIECSFCRLVTHTGFHTLRSTTDEIDIDGSNVYCELCPDIAWNRYQTRIRLFCLKLTIPSLNEDHEIVNHGYIQQILTSDEHPPEQRRNDSRLVKDQIDLELVRCWLETCKEQHNSEHLEYNCFYSTLTRGTPRDIHDTDALIYQPCEPVPINPIASDLTLIDVKRECLVDMPLKSTYIALSYVWGGSQSFQHVISRKNILYNPHSISVEDDAIPLTIRDAIRLAADLGEKYLWVDSLCICQDDMENKMDQIKNMGNIYSQALFTVVAASGSNAHAGLPGVRAFSRRIAQRAEYVQGMVLVNGLPRLEEIIEQSHWNTRGWTYQEKLLSTRYLIFCQTHVFFQCNRTVLQEDSGLRYHAIVGRQAAKIRGERRPIWDSYRRAVVQYTKRTLSNESDLLNAFQGIISLLQPAFKGDFLFGLPETELDTALLWQPTSLMRRRINSKTGLPLFPSWSWARWIAEVDYIWTRHQLDDLSRVEWQCTDSTKRETGFCSSDELRLSKYGKHDHWEFVPNERGSPYYYQHNDPDIWCLHPVVPKDERKNHLMIQPGSHRLVFKAYTAFFRVSTWCPFSINGALCPLDIYDRDGFVAGRIYVPLLWMGTPLKSEFQEFVCLSRRRWNQLDNGPALEDEFMSIPDQVTLYPYVRSSAALDAEFDHRRYNMCKPWPLYNVMMIGWDNGVAFRIAVGTLHVTAFLQAKPVKRLITLI